MLPWLKTWQLCGQHGTSRSGVPVATWQYSISSWHARERNLRVQVMNYPMRKSPEVPRQPVISQVPDAHGGAMNVASFLTKAARTFADRPAVSLGTETCLTYGALGNRVAQLAGTLTHRFGLQPGDCVALAMSNSPEYIEILYAVWHAGLTAVPMNAKLHQREFAYILENSGARLCFATPDLVETVAPLTQEIACLEAVIATGDAEYRACCTGAAM